MRQWSRMPLRPPDPSPGEAVFERTATGSRDRRGKTAKIDKNRIKSCVWPMGSWFKDVINGLYKLASSMYITFVATLIPPESMKTLS